MTFSFVHISDHHLHESEDRLVRGFSPAHAFRSVMRSIGEKAASKIDFIVSTGDLVEPATDATYHTLRSMLQLEGHTKPPGPYAASIEGMQKMPMYFMPGNHDDREPFFRNLFPSAADCERMNVTFEHKGIQFICVDWGQEPKASSSADLFPFLRSALQAGKPSIVLSHHHLVPTGSRWLDNFIADDIDEFWETLQEGNVLGVLSGHVHMSYEQVVGEIPVFGLRSTAFPFALTDRPLLTLQPPQYRLVTVQDGVLTSRIYEVYL